MPTANSGKALQKSPINEADRMLRFRFRTLYSKRFGGGLMPPEKRSPDASANTLDQGKSAQAA